MSPSLPPALEHLMLRTIAMPADTNPYGNIFGGWLLSQMDIAASIAATRRSNGPVVTVAIQEVAFQRPVSVGDEVSCYAEVIKIGRTSLTVQVTVWIKHRRLGPDQQAAAGTFVFVALDEHKRPHPVDRP